jgi:tetratricopeptide (TPR) repeat protein
MSLFPTLPKKTFYCIVLLVGLTFLAFCPVLKAQFLNWQDDKHLTGNINVLVFDGTHLKVLFKERVEGLHIPLSSLSLSLEHHWFGLNPVIVHLDNLLLHIAVIVLVFFFAQNLGLSLTEAFLGAFIFALHPTKVESVAWISERKDVLYAVFYMAALVSYQKNKIRLSTIFGLLSLLANPLAISLPLILCLMDWFNGKTSRSTLTEKWPYFLMAVLIGSVTYGVYFKAPVAHIIQAPMVWVWTFSFYILKFFIPIVSTPLYSVPKPISLFSWDYSFAFLFFIIIVLGVWFKRRNKGVIFAFTFFLLSIFFAIPLEGVKDNNVIADHFLYLSTLGFCLFSAVGIIWLYHFLKGQEAIIRHLFSSAVIILMIGLMILTFNQSLIWHDAKSLWSHQIKVLPHPLAFNNLAEALRERGSLSDNDYTQVIHLYEEAIKIDSHYMRSYSNLADLYKEINKPEKALECYNQALSVDNKDKEVLFGLGTFYQKMEKPQEAINTFKRLLKLYPDNESVYISIVDAYNKAIASGSQEKAYHEQREEVLSEYEELSKRKKYSATDYFNLGFLYEQVGGYDEAIRFYKKSLQMNPTYEKSLYNLANRYQEMGDNKTALILYQRLVHFHPKFALGYLNMGVIYNSLGDVPHARMLYQKTLEVDPDNAGAYFNLGYLSEASGNLKDALNYYEKSVDINPQLAEGYYNIGNVYAALGQIPEAIASYLKTVSINKAHQNAFVNLSILSFKSRDFSGAIRYLKEAQNLGYNPPGEYLKSLKLYQKK